ncbi:hypothetical protein GCM10014719_59090 [Planomonospora parontospora subsp. antibiotica]|uniref:hypothetical protein n=1 Tax=Planomonospora parontospora TaxID=58119 RepID=UPI00167185AB|nr:hypothetical protein [Planomonospora parontospora]GGL50022.1 hypothetical protein GCM10014719_59090 [Planomonospora parontospora subsp. antibiotica]GII19345.1 hypothetical protein Ppa05_60710 [Planomonospora parontospora subsp. antibiotica]
MSDGCPTAPRKEALRLICTRGPLDTDRLGWHLPRARPAGGAWSTTAAGRRVISCSGERA